MEGAGEGVVAILQGTKHAGLRVTLVPDNRLRSKRKGVLMDSGVRPPTRITHSSVKTNTERIFKNASAPMCDVRYASSYQFANCKPVQSSFRVSEMPVYSTFYRPSDQFADSLRKYPVLASSEILQRIINYSNTRQHTRKQNSKSIRSLLRKSTSQQINRRYESGFNTNNEIYKRRPLNKTIPTIGSRYSSQNELLSYKYDYLKCMSLIPRSTDVRYLTRVKKCIRNRLLDIIDDRPPICPGIRSRYSQHKRHFHGPAGKPILTSSKNVNQESHGTTKRTHMSCKNSSYSRRKLNYFNQPNKCDCKHTLDKNHSLESLMRKLYPELNVCKKEIPSKVIVQEPKQRVSEDFTIKPHDGVDDEIMSAVSEWLKSIPVYPNFSENDKLKQKDLALKLSHNLSLLKNQVDFIFFILAKKEIMSCVNDLPMWYPPYLNDKKKFIDRIVADLLKRLVNVFEKELRYKVAQAISNLPYTENVDTEKIVDDFVYKLKSIVLHSPEDEKDYMNALKPKILDLLNKLPLQCTVQKKNDVADKLVKQLLEFRPDKSLRDELMNREENIWRENILKWCENVPELKDIDFAQNNDLIDELANKFKTYEISGPNDESMQEELKKSIRTWLDAGANLADLRLDSKIKNRLGNQMFDHFFGKNSNKALAPLLKWYYGIQKLADDERTETRKAIDRLAKELNRIQSRNNGNFDIMFTDMKEVVTGWLQDMLKKRGTHLDSKVLDNFVNKLLSELNVIYKREKQRPSSEYGQFYRDVVSWIKDITYLKPESYLNETKAIEKLVNKLNNIPKGSDIESTIIEAITKFIKSLSASLQVRIQEEDIQNLKDKLFERLQKIFKQRKRWDKIYDLSESILSEFSQILQAYSNILDDTKLNNINNKFNRKFVEHLDQNSVPNWKHLLQQLHNIFIQETKLSKQDCEDLANDIITRLQKMFPQEVIRRSIIVSQAVKTYVEPTKIIEHNLEATKKHRTQQDNNDSESAYAKNKNKKRHHRKTNLQAGDGRKSRKNSKTSIIFTSSKSDIDTHNSVDYYDNKYEISDDQIDRSVLNEQKEYQTSTPLSAAMNIFPIALDDESSIGNVTGDTQRALLHERELSSHTRFLLELKNVITDWIKSIDPNINKFDLDNAVDSIASDIIERQKYLQLSETKYSENDELEHLKYQIFRNLNKLKKVDLLPQIMSKINSLYRIIKNISVPGLIKPVHESRIPTTSGSYVNIFNKIRHWLDSVPCYLLKSSNIKQNPVVINKLAQNIGNVKHNNQDDYEIQKEILLWLQNVLRNCNNNTFHKLAEDLKSNLQDIALQTSNILIKDTSTFIDENILEAIASWLQTAPFHKICTLEDRNLQKKLSILLATNLTKILQEAKNEADNLNDQLIEEVQKYLKTIPIPAEFKNNIYYYKAAGELVEYLKQMITKIKDMCDGINTISTTFAETNTENDYIRLNDLVEDIISNWCNNLPIYLGHSPENKEQAQKLKDNIIMGLLEMLYNINQKQLNNDIDFETTLSDEIHKIFKNVPMNRELQRSLPVLKSILIEKLKQAKNETQSLVPKKILHETLTKTLQEIENTPDLEQASLNLLKEKLADAFINLHYQSSTDYEFRDKLKEKLYNEINKFCNAYLERHPHSPIDTDELQFNLYAILKRVLLPDMSHPDVSDESSKLSFEKEVSLKNSITQYSRPQFLPSTLSNEDRSHLEIIRKRASSYSEKGNSERLHRNRSPELKEVGVLTDFTEKVEENVQTSKTLLPEIISPSKEIVPQVVIKEFYWDSNGSKQSLQMFVPPAFTTHKIIHRKKDTNNSQNQTETNVINNSTKVNISQKFPETRKESNNKVYKASDATSKENHEKREQLTNTYLNSNSPIQESSNNETIIIPKDSIHRQLQTEKPFHQYHRKRDTYPDRVFDNGYIERYWIEQPRNFEDNRYIQKDRQPSYLEGLVKTPGDRRILSQRIYLTPENRNKENICCDHNINWRMGEDACRRRCNTLKHCSKCYGGYCPHPTMAFFKKTF